MFKRGIEGFPYYFGVAALDKVATRDDRVCVLNILGGESRQVTPISHAFSGGNVVFGTSPGRRGQVLPTPIGDVPVYNNVREGARRRPRLQHRRRILCRRPACATALPSWSVSIPISRRSFMITEKISVRDAREIRALGQANGVDIFGANCLGVADSWNRVRIGGALGGDNPEEVLLQGFGRVILQLRWIHDDHCPVSGDERDGERRLSSPRARTSISIMQHVISPIAIDERDARSKAAVALRRTGRLLRARP